MMSSLKPGRCRYGLMCNENGFLFDDGVVARLNEKTFLCHTTTGGSDRVYCGWKSGTKRNGGIKKYLFKI